MTRLLFVRITNKRARRDRARLQSSPRVGGRGGFSNRAPLARPTRRSAGCRIAAGFAQTRRSSRWSAQAQVPPQTLLRRTMSWRISMGVGGSSNMARRGPFGRLHQRADRKSTACSRNMPPAPPRVREEIHRPDELTRAAVLPTTTKRARVTFVLIDATPLASAIPSPALPTRGETCSHALA
jgi:hypothetical protein